MLWPRLLSSKLSGDSGSAVIEFVLVLVPTSLLAIPLVSIVALAHESVVTQQVAYEVARYGALADTSALMDFKYLNARDPSLKIVRTKDESSCLTEVLVAREYPVGLKDLSVSLESRASVQCEDF